MGCIAIDRVRVQFVVGSTSPLWIQGLLDLLHTITTIDVAGVAMEARHVARLVSTQAVDALVIEPRLLAEARKLLPTDFSMPRCLLVGPQAHIGTKPLFGPDSCCGYFSEREHPRTAGSLLRTVAFCTLARASKEACLDCPVRCTLDRPRLPISRRENEVFERLGWGEGPTEIAEALSVEVKTIETYRESLKCKLGAKSAADLRVLAAAWRDGHLVGRSVAGYETVSLPLAVTHRRSNGRKGTSIRRKGA